jgi:hypothetical protein
MEHLGDMGHVESRFRPFGDGARFPPNVTKGSKIILDALDGTPM